MITEDSTPEAGAALRPGEVLGDYQILATAGAGGMGVVYRATQRSLGRVVALKSIRGDIARAPEYRARFLREARLAASVDHPNVVSVYDVGDQEGHLFLAMQWIDGEDLKQILERHGRLTPERAVVIASQIAGALDAVHSIAGLVHRDVKPANVLVRRVDGADHAYLTDFGVAKPSETADGLTQTGWVVGTSGYLAPEQIKGAEPGPRSDLYALGCVFYEALTAVPPFRGENEMALRWAHANDQRPLPSQVLPTLGTRYDQFISVALAIDPQHRFASGREFGEALRAAAADPVASSDAAVLIPPHTPTAVGPPTPLPATGHLTPPPPPMYPNYAYATPAPTPPPQGRSGNPLALILLGLVALAGVAVGALAAAGVFSHSGAAQTITSVKSGVPGAAPEAARKAAPNRAHGKAARRGSAAVPPTTTSCGGDLSVGPATSCPFGQNVEQAYVNSSGGNTDVVASSPVTGATYTMHCTAGSPHVCRGGNNATVYFTAGPTAPPAPTQAPSTNSGSTNLTACDQNISAGSGTSCPFAENVFRSYAADYKQNGEQSRNSVNAVSPVTGRSYSMSCTNDGVTVNCSGGNNAFVTFPYQAVVVY